MPTYDYRCRQCGHLIEVVHSILDDGPRTCDRCQGPLQRVPHPAGVIFKGSGFYATDSRPAEAPTAAQPGPRGGSGSTDSGPEAGSGPAAGD